MTTFALTEHEFEKRADAELKKLSLALDEVDDLEADLQMGVLTITFTDGTRYVVSFTALAASLPLIAFIYVRWGFDTLFLVLASAAAVILKLILAGWSSRPPRFSGVSSAMMRPRLMMATRSARNWASSM